MKKSTTIILALICCVLWAIVFPILKLLYIELNMTEDNAKLTLAGMRFFMAGILVLLYYIAVNRHFPRISSFKLFSKISILGIFHTTLLYAFFFIGASNTSGIKSAVLSQSSIFFVAILAHFLLKGEKISLKKGIALLLGIIGMITINVNSFGSFSELLGFKFIGEGYLLFSGFFNGIGTIITKKMGKNLDPIFLNGWQLTIGGGLLLVIGLFTYGNLITFPNIYSFLLFVSLILVSSIAFTLWFRILKNVKASEITIFKFTIPIIGAFSSALVVPGETMSIFTLLGLLLVSLGIYYCNKKPSGKESRI